MRMKAILWIVLVCGAIAPLLAQDDLPPASYHLAMGNPSGAKHDAREKDNYLLEKPYYALSYNNARAIPNWVSWHLSKEYLGKAPRKPRFDPDSELPRGFFRAAHIDYTGSGFDRGHLCPHGDRQRDKEMAWSTFVMTNIVPQSHECNAGAWESLESYERHLAKKGKDLFIVAGPIGQGGEGANGPAKAIAGERIEVPAKLFKVLLVVERKEGTDPTKWVDGDARLIAVIMPNDRSVDSSDWGRYRCTVEEVERESGLRFFDKAPADILGPMKKKVDEVRLPKLPKGS